MRHQEHESGPRGARKGGRPGREAPVSDRISLTFDLSPDELSLEAITQRALQCTLGQTGQNKSSAARLLKASRKLFY